MSDLSIIKNEQQILRCIIESNELIFKLEDNYFISELGKSLFETFSVLINNDVSITASHIVNEGNKKNNLITEELYNNLLEVDFEIDSFGFYFKRLKKDYAKDKLQDVVINKIVSEVAKKDDMQLRVIKNFITEMEDCVTLIEGKEKVLLEPKDIYDNYCDIINKRASGEYIFSFGDSHLDSFLTEGAVPGNITTLFGPTGGGKSAFALHLVNSCINKKIPIIYDSLEMDKVSTMDRLIAMRNKFPMRHLFPDENGQMVQNVYEILAKEKEKFEKMKNFYFIEDPNQEIKDIKYFVKEAKKKFKTDYLIYIADLYTMFKDSGNTPQEIEDGMNRLHALVKENKIHFVPVVQSNRNMEGHQPKDLDDLDKFRPTLANVKNSGAFAERSRILMSAFRPKYYANRFFEDNDLFAEELAAMDDIYELQILKQNQGLLSTIKYLFMGETYSFYKTKEG